MSPSLRQTIQEAVARGWGHPENSAKPFDVQLSAAISREVEDALEGRVVAGDNPRPVGISDSTEAPS